MNSLNQILNFYYDLYKMSWIINLKQSKETALNIFFSLQSFSQNLTFTIFSFPSFIRPHAYKYIYTHCKMWKEVQNVYWKLNKCQCRHIKSIEKFNINITKCANRKSTPQQEFLVNSHSKLKNIASLITYVMFPWLFKNGWRSTKPVQTWKAQWQLSSCKVSKYSSKLNVRKHQ